MKRFIGLSALVSVLALGGGIAQAQTQAMDPEQAQLMCDLTGDCSEDAPAAATGASAPPARSGARTSQTRGFSFNRSSSGTAQGTPSSAPVQTGSVGTPAPAPVRSLVRPAKVGAADLKLTFVTGSATLTEEAKTRLDRYAAVLGSPKLAARRLRIEGHTDASGSARANQDLSRRRAQAVADYLAAAGVDSSRLVVVGLGSSQPLPGIPAQAAANRRVMAVLL